MEVTNMTRFAKVAAPWRGLSQGIAADRAIDADTAPESQPKSPTQENNHADTF